MSQSNKDEKLLAEIEEGRLFADEMAQKREVAIVGFGPMQTLSDFQTPDVFQSPTLAANGDKQIGAAIEAGLNPTGPNGWGSVG